MLFAEKQIYNNNQQINILLIEIDHNPLQEIRVPTMKFKLDVQRKGKTSILKTLNNYLVISFIFKTFRGANSKYISHKK